MHRFWYFASPLIRHASRSVAGCVFVATACAQSFTMSELSLDIPTAYAVVSADLDGDGDLDAAATGMSAGLTAWIENRGFSTLTHQLHYFANGVRGITSADFDGDGDTDLMVAAYGENRIVMFRNVGGGGVQQFERVTVYEPCNGPFAVRAGDFDGDGDADLISTDYRGNVARLFVQQNNALQPGYAVSVPSAFDIVMADYDRDGDNDLIVESESDGMFWLEQVSPMAFSPHELGVGPSQVAIMVTDLDSDSDMDIVGAAFSQSQIIWWERSGQGLTAHPLPGVIEHPRGLGIADFNNDGALDVVATGQSGDVVWWRRSGQNFVLQSLVAGSGPHGLCVTDYDQDGDLDVLVADYWASSLRLYRNVMGIPAVIVGEIRSEALGDPISGVRVTVLETGVQTLTDTAGRFTTFTRSGSYTLEASHPCWNTDRRDGVSAESGDTTTVDFALVRAGIEVGVTSLNLIVPNHELRTAAIPVRSTGDGLLQVLAEATESAGDGSWLEVAPSELTISAGDSAVFTVTVSPDTTDDANRDYYGSILLRTNACPDSVLRVAVLVYVLALDAPGGVASVPGKVALYPVRPNPFNGSARIEFVLDYEQSVRLAAYDVMGRLSAELLSEVRPAGSHSVLLDGAGWSSGIYLISLETSRATLVEKVFLLK